ncbi:hypothetical protein FKM82_031372 [Ascaphus truei]
MSINLWNVAGAPCNPYGIVTNWYKPRGVAKAVLHLDSSARGICQYPFVRSRVEIYSALPSESSNSSTLGIGYASNLDTAFTFRKSTQNLTFTSGLGTNTIGLHHSLWDSSITPNSNMSIISLSTRSFRPSGNL